MPEKSQSNTSQPNVPTSDSSEKTQPEQKVSKPAFSKPVLVTGGIIGIIVLVLSLVAANIMLSRQETPSTAQQPVPPTSEELKLVLDSPTDGALAVENEILVQGTTEPNATVAVFTETDETIIEADSEGKFETTVQLSPGINSLNITAFSEEGNEKTITLNIVYDDEE